MSNSHTENVEVILPNTVYGVPSCTYDGSSLDFFSEGVRGAGYYRGYYGAIQTIFISVNGFIGTIQLQATLGNTDEESVFFDIDAPFTGVGGTTGTFPITVVGNFTWIRAEVKNFTSGTIYGINAVF
jgi:hypothetical protein